MKNITKMLFLVSDFFSKFVKLFGFDSKRNPYSALRMHMASAVVPSALV